jgi:hypothetical protein
MDDSIFVGLDVHKATVSVAVAEASRGGEVRHVGVVANRPDHIGKLVERLVSGLPRPARRVRRPELDSTRPRVTHSAEM